MFRFERALEWLDSNARRNAVLTRPRVFQSPLITRRHLLAGSALISAALLIPSGATSPLKVLLSDDGIVVWLNDYVWKIDRSSFGPTAIFSHRQERDRHFITVRQTFMSGVDLPMDFSADLQLTRGQWWLSLDFRYLGTKFRVPLEPWLALKYPASSQTYIKAIRIGSTSANIALVPQPAAISLTPDWCFEWQGESVVAAIHFDGLIMKAARFRLSLGGPETASVADLLKIGPRQGHATLDLIGPDIAEATAIPGLVGSHPLQLRFDAVALAQVAIVGQGDGSATSVVSVTGEASANVLTRPAGMPILSNLRLAPASLIAPSSDLRNERLLLARITPAAHVIETSDVVLTIAGRRDAGIVTAFRGGVSAPIRILTDLYAASVPVAGADTSEIAFTQTPLLIDIGGEPPSEAPRENQWLMTRSETAASPIEKVEFQSVQAPDTAEPHEEGEPFTKDKTGLLLLDRTPFFAAPLEGGRLRILRSRDLLSLTFGFRNFAIEVKGGRATLVPRPIVAEPSYPDAAAHRLIVEFPPQHVAEEAKKTQLGIGGADAGDIDKRDRFKKPTLGGGTGKATGGATFDRIVKARLSGPTRLVFRIKPDDKKNLVRKELSVKTLTEWSDLAQVVSERALAPDSTLAEQVKLVGIDKSTNRGEALVKIIQSVLAPRDDETAIELPYRLLLSPDADSRWITPQQRLGPLGTPTLLWNARLDPVRGGQSVRAIWARDLLLDFLRGNRATDLLPPERNEQKEPPFTLSLSRSDRRELVTLSSVYALPALGRVITNKDVLLDPNNITNNGLSSDPAGTVQPFPQGIGLWGRKPGPVLVPDEGMYVPKPLKSADISLTAMGGTFVGEGQWEPPSPIVDDGSLNSGDPDIRDNWRPTLRLERWRHRAVLGRDIFVEVAYKGFLFPIGHRASLLKVTERRFYPHPDTGRSTAYLIQRLFIVIGNREKNFPAIGQSYDGRLWPAHAITMATARTPDLVDPEDNSLELARRNGRLSLKQRDSNDDANGLVFWPRLKSYDATKYDFKTQNIDQPDGNEVSFEFLKDQDDERITAPFLFVDNVAAHEPATMDAVVDYYRDKLADDNLLRRASHGSVRRRYAPALKDGETDFDTQSWTLSATGRFIDDDAEGQIESYRVDGAMEGADQPPYYPVLRTANIKVQSIDRLIGRSAGSMTVAINELFVRHGFASEQNPSELFLDVLSPPIQLDFSGGGDVVGGLAKPNARLVALSRKFGPVGGRPPPPQGSSGSNLRSFLATSARPAPIGGADGLPARGDYAAFSAGRFDPREFLGGADSLPKILGVFPLGEVLKVVAFAGGSAADQEANGKKVPKLQEKTSFGGGGVDLGDQVDKAKQVIRDFARAFVGDDGNGGLLNQALKEIDDAVAAKFGANFSWRSLYPRLAAAFDGLLAALRNALVKLPGLPKSDDGLSQALNLGSQAIAAGKALLAEAAAVRDNPMPAAVGEILDVLQKEWEKVRRFTDIGASKLETVVEDIKTSLIGQATKLLVDLLSDPNVAVIVELVLGPAVLDVPYNFSASVAAGDPGDKNLRLNNTTQKDSTIVRVDVLDAEGNPTVSLPGAAVGAVSPTNCHLLLAHRTNAGKSLLFNARAVASKVSDNLEGYREFTVAGGVSLTPSPFVDGDAIRLVSLPDFNTSDPHAITSRISNALMYEIAGEPMLRAQAAVVALFEELGHGADETVRDVGAKLMTVTTRVFDAALAVARTVETSDAMASITTWCAEATSFAVNICDKVLGTSKELSTHLNKVADVLSSQRLTIPEEAPRDVRVRVDQARAAMAQAQDRLARATATLKTEREKIAQFKDCGQLVDALRLSGTILALRRDAVAALQDLLLQARAIAAALAEITEVKSPASTFARGITSIELADARKALRELIEAVLAFVQDVTSIKKFASAPDSTATSIHTAIEKLVTQLKANEPRYRTEIAEIESARDHLIESAKHLDARARDVVIAVGRWVSDPSKPFPPDLAAMGTDVLGYATQHDRRLAALVLQSSQTFDDAREKIEGFANAALLGIVTPMISVHEGAISVIDAIAPYIDERKATAANKELARFLTLILTKEVVERLTDKTEIQKDLAALADIKTKAAAGGHDAFPPAFELRTRWSAQDPALVRSVKEIARIVESLAQGNLSTIINLDRVRTLLEEQLKNALLDFLPTKIELNYDWQTELQPFLNIFEMTKSGPDDLTLSAHVSIDVLNGRRTTTVRGNLKPFKIHILGKQGETGNFLSVIFDSARFMSVNGGTADFHADIADVQIGPALQFVQSLQAFLGGYAGGGFYVRPTLFPLGIEAGFEYSEKVIPCGPLIFYNVAFSVSAQLPFQDRDARFRFALASADAPFMISYPPYGGGGFFAIVSNGREIVEAECSFEAGCVVGCQFGPLAAVARCMVGIYIRQGGGGGAYIKGFFHAIGEGSIACFSISVCIEVAVIHYRTGKMEGQSTYSFSFKVGFAEISYSVTATYAISGGSSSAQGFAPSTALLDQIKANTPPSCHGALNDHRVTTRVHAKTRHWDRYRKYVDLNLLNA